MVLWLSSHMVAVSVTGTPWISPSIWRWWIASRDAQATEYCQESHLDLLELALHYLVLMYKVASPYLST
jgi:hypothetical protein